MIWFHILYEKKICLVKRILTQILGKYVIQKNVITTQNIKLLKQFWTYNKIFFCSFPLTSSSYLAAVGVNEMLFSSSASYIPSTNPFCYKLKYQE